MIDLIAMKHGDDCDRKSFHVEGNKWRRWEEIASLTTRSFYRHSRQITRKQENLSRVLLLDRRVVGWKKIAEIRFCEILAQFILLLSALSVLLANNLSNGYFIIFVYVKTPCLTWKRSIQIWPSPFNEQVYPLLLFSKVIYTPFMIKREQRKL